MIFVFVTFSRGDPNAPLWVGPIHKGSDHKVLSIDFRVNTLGVFFLTTAVTLLWLSEKNYHQSMLPLQASVSEEGVLKVGL